jgi:hypothetical protein
MLVAERHIIKKGHRFWAEIDNLSWQSKNLYNSANYLIRQNFIYGHGYLTYNQMASLRSDTEQYQALYHFSLFLAGILPPLAPRAVSFSHQNIKSKSDHYQVK